MKLLTAAALLGLAIASPIDKRQYAGVTTENQFTNGSPCRAITILFARGTTEAGNVGSLAGPPFFQAVANAVGASNVAVQGVCPRQFLEATTARAYSATGQLRSDNSWLPCRR